MTQASVSPLSRCSVILYKKTVKDKKRLTIAVSRLRFLPFFAEYRIAVRLFTLHRNCRSDVKHNNKNLSANAVKAVKATKAAFFVVQRFYLLTL